MHYNRGRRGQRARIKEKLKKKASYILYSLYTAEVLSLILRIFIALP